jgi:RNA polymerase sigma-70 factor (ECF subfamily)
MEEEKHERFTRLLIQHEPELMRCILVAVPNRSDARDILQECSVALWRKFGNYEPDRPFVPWALGFARFEIRRFLRKSARSNQLTERAAELLLEDQKKAAAELDHRKTQLQDCLDLLSERQKEMVNGYYRMEYSVSDLSHRTGQTVDAIYKSLQRIRRSLHDCVESRMRGVEA